MALLSCRKISDGSYMLDNVAYECYTDVWYAYTNAFLIPLLFLFTIIFPIWIIGGMFYTNKQKKLQNIEYRYKYGFLCQEYRTEVYFWEFVKFYQKTLI